MEKLGNARYKNHSRRGGRERRCRDLAVEQRGVPDGTVEGMIDYLERSKQGVGSGDD